MRRIAYVPACALALLAGCGRELREVRAETQLTLQVTANPALGIDDLEAKLWVSERGRWTAGTSVRIAPPRWPVDIPIIPAQAENDAAELEVLLVARVAGQVVTERRVVTAFVPGRRDARVSTVLATCGGAGTSCAPPDCHGPECATCAPVGACAAAGRTPAVLTGDEDEAVDGGGLTGRERDPGGTTDGGGAEGAASADGGASALRCPTDHTCSAAYPCVPRRAGGYTCRGQWADWPMPDALLAPLRYTSTGSTAVDEVTKLEWQVGIPSIYPGCTAQLARRQPGSSVSELGARGELCRRDEGIAYCEALEHGGHTDWRMPTMIELVSLFASRAGARFDLDPDMFGDTDWGGFATRATPANKPALMWDVQFVGGQFVSQRAEQFGDKVRCVRGGAEPPFATPAERYQIDATTVLDRATRLLWQRQAVAAAYPLSELIARCQAGGFRVPTAKELMTLVDVARAGTPIDEVAFPDTPRGDFFAYPKDDDLRTTLSFETGELVSYATSAGSGFLRCVRTAP